MCGGRVTMRRVFFSFHFRHDIWRVNQIRNLSKVNADPSFEDVSLWEEAERKGVNGLRDLINPAIKRASVICVLIGSETASSKWVRYEIWRSITLRKGIFGIRIHKQKNQESQTSSSGENPFKLFVPFKTQLFLVTGTKIRQFQTRGALLDIPKLGVFDSLQVQFSNSIQRQIKIYDWVDDSGVENFQNWVEVAHHERPKFE